MLLDPVSSCQDERRARGSKTRLSRHPAKFIRSTISILVVYADHIMFSNHSLTLCLDGYRSPLQESYLEPSAETSGNVARIRPIRCPGKPQGSLSAANGGLPNKVFLRKIS